MTSDIRRVIIRKEEVSREGAARMNIHHRDFPELWAEATTADQCARRLAERLGQACEWTCESWRREALMGALADVDEYLRGCALVGADRN